jgi:hypothetical protein
MRYAALRLGAASIVCAGLLGTSAIAWGQAPPAPPDTMATYTALLSGANEVPAVQTTGTGNAEITYDTQTKTLTWTVEYSGLSGPATGAHFHGPAGPGENAGVVISLGDNLTSPIQGTATLTDEQADQLASGLWYVNVHTGANSGGEIRGPVTAEIAEVGQPR